MNDNQEDLRFLTYKLHIRDCVRQVQIEMGLGNIDSEESLLEVIDRVSQFESASESFFFFHLSAPYEWSEYVTDELLKAHDYDLGLVAISVASMVVSSDVYSEIAQTEGYRHLIEGKQTRKILVRFDGEPRRITLREMWKSRAALFDHLSSSQISIHNGKTLAIYRRDEGSDEICFSVLLEHDDPTLVWKSKRHFIESKPVKNSIDYYEEMKCDALLHHGCPDESLWLTEVQTVDQFDQYFSTDDQTAAEFYGLEDYDFVVYYHENGEVHAHAGFNDEAEFDLACKTIADYLKE